MAQFNRLNALKVARENRPGMHADRRGLYLQIGQGSARSWILRYQRDGRERFCGLGPAHLISLADARERADQARRQLVDGVDPIDAKRAPDDGTAQCGKDHDV